MYFKLTRNYFEKYSFQIAKYNYFLIVNKLIAPTILFMYVSK